MDKNVLTIIVIIDKVILEGMTTCILRNCKIFYYNKIVNNNNINLIIIIINLYIYK